MFEMVYFTTNTNIVNCPDLHICFMKTINFICVGYFRYCHGVKELHYDNIGYVEKIVPCFFLSKVREKKIKLGEEEEQTRSIE